MDHGILMKEPRIVIPTSQPKQTLHYLHIGHKGIQEYKRPQETVYSPGIDADIEDFIQRCPACLAIKPQMRITSTTCHTRCARLKIGTDFFEFDGNKHPVGIDYFSKYPSSVR